MRLDWGINERLLFFISYSPQTKRLKNNKK
jgi:hypothetical protein